jgi:hypothetical protein
MTPPTALLHILSNAAAFVLLSVSHVAAVAQQLNPPMGLLCCLFLVVMPCGPTGVNAGASIVVGLNVRPCRQGREHVLQYSTAVPASFKLEDAAE